MAIFTRKTMLNTFTSSINPSCLSSSYACHLFAIYGIGKVAKPICRK